MLPKGVGQSSPSQSCLSQSPVFPGQQPAHHVFVPLEAVFSRRLFPINAVQRACLLFALPQKCNRGPCFHVFGQDAVVECPDGMVYSPLEVTQGVPPFGGVNGLEDFIAAGCDSTTSTCVVRVHRALQCDRRWRAIHQTT